jgi:hypothetical protein
LLAQAFVFFLAAVTPVDALGFAQGGHVGDPGDQPGVFDMGRHLEVQAMHGGVVHGKAPKLKSVMSTSVCLHQTLVDMALGGGAKGPYETQKGPQFLPFFGPVRACGASF